MTERITGLCASAANAHVDGVSAQEGLGLGSGWCDVALGAGAPATAGPAVGSAASSGRAEYATESAVCSVTGEPAMRTIAHAKASGDWDGPGGRREAHKKDFDRCFTEFGCMRIVPMSEYFAARRQLGAMVEMLYIVTVWKQKRTAANIPTRRAVRFTVAHLNDGSPMANTFAANVDAQSIRLLAQLAVALPEAKQRFRDVPGAYYRGTPVPVSEGVRKIYCRVPTGWAELCDIQPNSVIEVGGNMLGLREAGATWAREYDKFMCAQDMTQSVADRRIYFKTGASGLLVVGVHVDDNFQIATSSSLASQFDAAWTKAHGAAVDDDTTFCGTLYTDLPVGSRQLSMDSSIDDLGVILHVHVAGLAALAAWIAWLR